MPTELGFTIIRPTRGDAFRGRDYGLAALIDPTNVEIVSRGYDRQLHTAFGAEPRRSSRVAKVFGERESGRTTAAIAFAVGALDIFDVVVYGRPKDLDVEATQRLMTFASDSRRPLVILDDVDTADQELPIVRALLNRKRQPSLLLVGEQFYWGAIEDRRDAKPVQVLHVERFSVQEAAQLAQQMLGIRPTRLQVEQLHERFQGRPGPMTAALRAYSNGTPWEDALKLLSRFEASGILGPDGRPLDAASVEFETIVTAVKGVSLEVLARLAKEPNELYKLSPRLFEEVVTEIFSRKGYAVELTPASRDGGRDILAFRKDSVGTFLTLVECKRYGPTNKVGVGLVRSLLGVVEHNRASAGILATTSYFTAGAQDFQKDVKFRIGLQDFAGLQKLLAEVTRT